MSVALTTARRGMPEREERTARRARFAVRGDAARGSRVICSICNGVVEDRTNVRVVCSCFLRSDKVMSVALTTASRGMPEREKRTARRARFAVREDAARDSRVFAANATEWWRTGPMCGWFVNASCTSAVRLGSWRTQLMAEPDRPRSHARTPPHTRDDNTLLWVPLWLRYASL